MEFEFDLENPLPPSNEKYPSLFYIENDHMPSKTYIQSLNSADLNLTIRREIVSSIFDLREVKPWILKLVAISCISLALKMRKTECSVSDLQDGGLIFDSLTIERMEMLILGALKWRMRSINPFSFINFFIPFFKFKDNASIQALKNRATEIILKAQNDIKLLEFKPSIVSATALLSATHELFPMQLPSFRDGIYSCTYVQKETLLNCYNLMQEVAMDGYESVSNMAKSSCTPDNVLDLHCFSSSISNSKDNQTSEITYINGNEIRDLKRRKIDDFAMDE
ncbi:hypothetical protein ACJIZ3_010807 [Penstemon smallii]|uniref:Cyclin C-terminal domain-containing protein n=1 Tax=Penstemon smallii TaxID=265156 RepID=A0ABD3UIU8_9LAMI